MRVYESVTEKKAQQITLIGSGGPFLLSQRSSYSLLY